MQIKSLTLQNFRNHRKGEFIFDKGITLFVGANAVGKTNILEAIYLLATGKSFRAEVESEMIHSGQGLAWIKGVVATAGDKLKLEIALTTGLIEGTKVAKKKYIVNGVARRMADFVGNLRVVYFGPQDMEIVVDSPSVRRNYLDSVLEQVDREYRRASLSYRKGLRQRNKLLEQIRDEGKPRSVLYFWDRLLIENGQLLTAKRQELINFVNDGSWGFGKLKIEYDRSLISPQRLEQYAVQEVASGVTLVGPHRDDFRVVMIEGDQERNLAIYGSRGEQRTAVFSLKLAELEYIQAKTEEKPVLLLDDIFSELDHPHRNRLLQVIPKQQTILTTSDIHLVEPEFRQKLEVVKL
jgi:DNA replication and repair protein RecF